MRTLELTKDLHWIGTPDPDLRVFDVIMYTEFGTSYNSYILKGSEKSAIFETSKAKYFDEYLAKIEEITPLEQIEYIIIDHTEPDHTGAIEMLLERNPGIKLVGSAAAMNFIKEICNRDFNSVVVKDGDRLSLGDKTLQFISAPNLHWPDSIYTYIVEERALITCDSFGAHYALAAVTNDRIENKEDYKKALRYYYDMIMGPFKADVLKAISKIDNLNYQMICPGHGPVLVENPEEIVELYREWSTEVNPNNRKTVVIPYVSAYGYTGELSTEIEKGIRDAGDIDVKSYDLVDSEQSEVLEALRWADGVLIGTPTVLGDALKPVWDLTTSMVSRIHGKKIASAFGSYGWSGEGVPHILQRLAQLDMKIYGTGLKIRFKPNDAQLQEAYEFGFNFGASVLAGKIVEARKKDGKTKKWKCLVCGEIVEGDEPPQACPVCGVGPEQFVEVEVNDVTFHSIDMAEYIVIGNGAAGTAACEAIRTRNKVCSIELISAENVIGYNRPMLTKGILSNLDPLNFFIHPYDWYGVKDIKLTLNTKVKEILPASRQIVLESGEVRDFDKLILATGAECFIPPIPGNDKDGVCSIRSLADINAISARLPQVEEVVVIGGGVLGLEGAWELCKAGKKVSIIELSPNLMGRQLDTKGSELLKKAAEKAGITVYTGVTIKEIAGEQKAEGVLLGDGTLVKGSMIVLSTGVKQNIELAAAIGMETTRSIVVNEKMETGISGIYACGDCAEFQGVNYAIWSEAVEMGKVAGANAVGDALVYEPVIPSNAFNGMNISLFAVGDNGKDPTKKYKSFEIYDEGKNTYEKLYFVNDRFCGGILMGDVSKSAKLLAAYEKRSPMSRITALTPTGK